MPTFSPEVCAEELLVVRCQLGERDAFDALISRWHEPVWRYLRRMSGTDDAAGDLAQETWLRVLRGVASLRDAASFRAWLFGIARRVAMDRFRREYARAADDSVNLEELPAPSDDEHLDADLAMLDSGLASLPPRERETLALFYLRELSLDEIAGLLAIPVGTVKSRLFRARQLLKTRLAGDRS